ncbi:CAF17-like 4Fe-4S cluster assembly/insertion protein YgfZ [Pseudoalteromonas sp. T1lg65]|uniref:CAF17-like 4Fe-4S cluster assembly/insertion protein YgfZ n=1 Tax=Pseudoalteromonas sp. T1lg65 TaxID=2077101 RepID=UPI003F7A464C
MSIARAFKLSHQVVSLTGQEKLSYLHGQVTQDINLIHDDNFMWSGHCSPKGKLWSVGRIFKYADGFHLLGSKSEIEASTRELKKYGVFAKVEITLSQAQVFGLICNDLTSVIAAFGASQSEPGNAFTFSDGKILVLDDERVLAVLFNDVALPDSLALEVDATPFIAKSILAGEPQLDENHIDEFVPQMVNLQALAGISFKKGCYTGQETVARMRYLGKNKRAMYIVSGKTTEALTETDIEVQLGDSWRRSGKVIHQTFDPAAQTYYALAVMPNDTEQEAKLRAKNSPQVELTLAPLPYSLEDN